jgi:hypothetical protein
MSTSRRARLGLAGLAATAVTTVVTGGAAHAAGPDWGFTPITGNALACFDSTGSPVNIGDPVFAPSLSASKLMSAGDAATQVIGGAATTVGRENDMITLSPDGKYLYTVSENGAPSDGVSRYTLTGPGTGTKEILTPGPTPGTVASPAWSRMDGAFWYTPSGVILGSEEYGAGAAGVNAQARGGGVWQINPTTGAFTRLDWLGSLSHEGVAWEGGALWFGDENRTGAIFKAVPTNPNDLTAGGSLYYMVGSGIDATGYKLVANADNAVAEAISGGAILFDRPEDFDSRNGRVYFTVTEPQADSDTRKGTFGGAGNAANQVVNRGGVYSVNATGFPDLATQSGATGPYNKITPMIEVQDPLYTTLAGAQNQQGLQFPDNIAFDGRGHLWVHEDIPDSSAPFTLPASGTDVSKQVRNQQDELWVYELNATGDAIIPVVGSPSLGAKAADMQSSRSGAGEPCANEFTGGVFAADGTTLYINQQHLQNPTFKVTNLAPPLNVPESPFVPMLAASGALVLGGGLVVARRRRTSVN